MTEIGPAGNTNSTPAVVYDFSAARARAEARRQHAPVDRTGFTDEALELAKARQAVDAAPEARAARVEALRDQIARGEYEPDARAIAEKMLESGF